MSRPNRRLCLAAFVLAWAASPAQAQTAIPDVTVTDQTGHAVQLSVAELQALPSAAASLAGEHGDTLHLTGPTLWSVLERAGAVEPNFHKRVDETLTVTGRDGYSASLAMGEIDPEFEGKPVLLAIDPQRHMLRLAIPGDQRLGRDVREVVGVTVR